MAKAFSIVAIFAVLLASAVFLLGGGKDTLPRLNISIKLPDASRMKAAVSDIFSGEVDYAPLNEHPVPTGVPDESAQATPVVTDENEQAKILFVGDIMLDRGVARYAERRGTDRIFEGVSELFWRADAIVGNLEGTITSSTSLSMNNSGILRFTFDQKFAAVLKQAGFTALSLANNHSYDFGKSGFRDTKDILNVVGVTTFGSALNSGELSARISAGDSDVCLVGYHDLYTPDPSTSLKETIELDPICPTLAVFMHWGDEYKPKPNARQKRLAHEFIDAGADIIIGAHPHVVQPSEVYKGRTIFYSLGNFVFDQDFSFETMHGLAVLVHLPREGLDKAEGKFELFPVAIKEGTVSIAEGEVAQKILGAAGVGLGL